MHSAEYEGTLAALKKVRDIQRQSKCEMDDEDLYRAMEQVSDDFDVKNAFTDKNRLIGFYRALGGLDEISWTDVIEHGDSNAKFKVPKVLIDEIKKIFPMIFTECLFRRLKSLRLAWSG